MVLLIQPEKNWEFLKLFDKELIGNSSEHISVDFDLILLLDDFEILVVDGKIGLEFSLEAERRDQTDEPEHNLAAEIWSICGNQDGLVRQDETPKLPEEIQSILKNFE